MGNPELERNIFMKAVEIANTHGIHEAALDSLKQLNVAVEPLKKNQPDFKASREKLQTNPGLVISNHPSGIDTSIILSQFNREDIKIVVNRKRIADLKILSKDLFLSAAKKPGQLREVLGQIQQQIESGGVVLIYPTGGQGRRERSNRGFQSGFRAITQKMKPGDMVYSFYITPAESSHSKNQGGIVTVDERYSEAAEWQEIISGSKPDNVNENLTAHFLRQFSKTQFE